jgi:small nuclear ribonucleoprotein (snRNP)-like protein
MVDLKNGETINGTLDIMDKFMNLKINNAVITSKDGD